ncbi:uridine diphosphate glucose pyrophosphatase NUDT14-like [Ciona intestinalis]
MEDVKVVSVNELKESNFIRPRRLKYTQAGKDKIWDYMIVHDSVAILIFDVSIKSVVLVRQFRPAVYMTMCHYAKKTNDQPEPKPSDGITYELCAGIIDRKEPPHAIAASEVLEETGYEIAADKLQLISEYRNGVGTSGSLQFLYYAQVDNSMKVSEGGGCDEEGEMIDLYNLPLKDIKSFIEDTTVTNRPVGVLFALQWFLNNKAENFKSVN